MVQTGQVVYNEVLSQDEIKGDMEGISFPVSKKGKLVDVWARIKEE